LKVRLNKFLASCGVGSRRAADALIAAGKVRIDGRRANLGDMVEPSVATVTVDGRHMNVQEGEEHVTLALNKPSGVVTTMRDERGRKTVADLLPAGKRLFPVGRLDAATTGLLLCTSDGELATFLLNPKNEVARTYRAIVRGTLDAPTIAALGARSVRTRPDGSSTFELSLREGRNRQVRRMCARQGLRVLALRRTQFGPIQLGNLKIGCTRWLTKGEMRELARLRGEREQSARGDFPIAPYKRT